MEHQPTHLVRFIRKNTKFEIYMSDVCGDTEPISIIRKTFRRWFKKPESVKFSHGTSIHLYRLSDGRRVKRYNVFNKSPKQALETLETAWEKLSTPKQRFVVIDAL